MQNAFFIPDSASLLSAPLEISSREEWRCDKAFDEVHVTPY